MQLSPSQEERLYLEVRKLLTEAEQNSRTESVWQLPDNWRGEKITWRQKNEDKGLSFWVGGMIVSVLVYLMADKDLHDEVEKRKIRMKRDYPDIVHKLTLYLGAGITIRGAFGRIVEEYEHDHRHHLHHAFLCRIS